MDEDKVSSLLNTIRRAKPFDLFILSFLLLPFVFDKWMDILTKANVKNDLKWLWLATVLIGYFLCVVGLVYDSHKRQKAESARDAIIAYLHSKGFTMMSFDRVRERIHPGYSDAYLRSVVRAFPATFRVARLKGGKMGLARITEENAEDEG